MPKLLKNEHRCEQDRRRVCKYADKKGECKLPSSEGWKNHCPIKYKNQKICPNSELFSL